MLGRLGLSIKKERKKERTRGNPVGDPNMHTRRARMAEQGTSPVTASPRHQKGNGGARRGTGDSKLS